MKRSFQVPIISCHALTMIIWLPQGKKYPKGGCRQLRSLREIVISGQWSVPDGKNIVRQLLTSYSFLTTDHRQLTTYLYPSACKLNNSEYLPLFASSSL